MSRGLVDKSTGDRIPTAGNIVDKVGDLTALHTTAKNKAVNAINEVADAVENLDADKTDTDMVAADFNAGTSYTAGNYCVQDGKLYRFKNNHSGAWSASDVEEVKIAGELSSIKSGLTNLDNEVNGDATTYPYADVITIEDAVPANVANCTVKIEPVQSGSGDPSPTNIRLITGHTEASVKRDGFNIWNGNATDGKAIANNGGTYNSDNNFVTGYIRVYPGVKYYVNRQNWESWIGIYDSEKQHTVGENVRIDTSDNSIVFAENVFYARFTGKLSTKQSACINIFNESLNGTYVPYAGQTYTIALGDTIYGGTVRIDSNGNTVMDVDSGVRVIDENTQNMTLHNTGDSTAVFKIITGQECVNDARQKSNMFTHDTNGWNSDIAKPCFVMGQEGNLYIQVPLTVASTVSAFTTWLASNNVQIFYPLKDADITTIQLTPTQIQLLKGTNTLTASTGQISVTVNGVSGSIGSVQEQVNDHEERIEDVESAISPLKVYAKWAQSITVPKSLCTFIMFGALSGATLMFTYNSQTNTLTGIDGATGITATVNDDNTVTFATEGGYGTFAVYVV